MPSRRLSLNRVVFGAFALLFATRAQAQSGGADLDPPLPNVLLLVDTSGSMEYKVDGSETNCANGEKSRWIDLIEVMTGSIESYSCEAVNRMSTSTAPASFLYDYANWSGYPKPGDYLYPTPYHRPLSGGCAILPRALPSNPYEFPDGKDDPNGAIRYRYRGSSAVASTPTWVDQCTFNQQPGVLDAFSELIRFGLMTFDPETDPRTGIAGSTVNYAEGMVGGWSYQGGTDVPVANPAGCTEPPGGVPFDAGARNAAAPPWEGRMVSFGAPQHLASSDLASASAAALRNDFRTKRKQIENVLLMTRPYGATPIAGLLKDASDFFLKDPAKDPLDPSGTQYFGPANDPYVKGGCRKQSIVLLTDGRPNLDLRPFCSDPDPTGIAPGKCPFETPEQIVSELRTEGIDTFVVPFALPTFTVGNGPARQCNDLTKEELKEAPGSLCGDNPDNEALQACCVLNRIAVSGFDPAKAEFYPNEQARPFFASNRGELASALSSVLSSTLNVTSRTQPVIAGASAGNEGMRFFTFVQPRPLSPWIGSIRRQRWSCEDGKAEAEDVDPEKGDDLAANLAAGKDTRRFITIRGLDDSNNFHSSVKSLRPALATSSDGLGNYGAERRQALTSAFPDLVTPEMASITAGSSSSTCPEISEATDCRDRILKWLVGTPNGTSNSRCDSLGKCNLLGDALRASPIVVGPPRAVLRDETYARFAAEEAVRDRPIVLYASTNDGFLHAFRVGTQRQGTTASPVTDSEKALKLENNELWAFVPPALLPRLQELYPFNHVPLLDTTPVVKDVAATRDTNTNVIKLERGQSEALAATSTFRTILVQNVGRGYYALDVTDPVLADGDPETKGPRFLWQVTTDSAGNYLFGTKGATPLITTLYFEPTPGAGAKEIAVAILPGGSAGPASASENGCQEEKPSGYTPIATDSPLAAKARDQVKCYSSTDHRLARSLTVVRLDTGEVIRTFRPATSGLVSTALQALTLTTPLEAPISGQPVAFPAEVGAVADRMYVGDQDGRLWRVDFADTDPAKWKMQRFFDTFPSQVGDNTLSNTWSSGQPITTAPVISVDEEGNVTLNVATGDQEVLGPDASMRNYVWSIEEHHVKVDGGTEELRSAVNWYKPLTGGERVVGPLTLFNSQLFFTTYTPPSSTNVCDKGSTHIWGMDYVRPNGYGTDTEKPDDGGSPRLRPLNDPENPEQFLTAEEVTGDENAIVFGVSVAQQPTCELPSAENTSPSTNPFFANSPTRKVRNLNPGAFELVMHKGGSGVLGGSTAENVSVMTLPTPPSSSRIDSWAALLE